MHASATATSRAEWQKRIERWNDSGLSAGQFAAELGINAGTLRHWKHFLGKQQALYSGSPADFGQANDPLIGKPVGGVVAIVHVPRATTLMPLGSRRAI